MHRALNAPTLDLPLSRFVESVRAVVPARGEARRVDRLPDGRTALVFRVLDGGHRGDVTVFGPRTRALLKEASGFAQAVMVQFKPGWSTPLLGVAASALTDQLVALDDLWGSAGRHLRDELLATTSAREALDRVTRALSRRLHPDAEPTSAPLARRAARLLEKDALRIEDVAARLGITPRHLRRAFAENIGVTPKEFARAARLQRALRLAASSGDWARIALDAGYYDQPHLIADFRALVGLTPGAWLARASAPPRAEAPPYVAVG